MSRASVSLPGLASSVPTARRFAESIITAWGHADVAWTAAQVVSELATNCALHARTTFTVEITVDEARVRIELTDTSPVPLRRRSHSLTATTGRGLRMVEMLTETWGVEANEGGKTVWAHLRLGEPGSADEDERLLAGFDELDVVRAQQRPDQPGGGPGLRVA